MLGVQNPFFQYQTRRTNFNPYIQAAGQAGELEAQAARQAGQLGVAGIQQAGNLLGAGNNSSQQFRQPYLDASQSSLGGVQGLLGLNPGVDPTQQLRATPGYQFQLQEGVDAINRGAAQQGKMYSGQTMKALQEYGQGLADKTYQQQVGNLMSLLGQTSPFAAQQAGQEFNLGNQQGQLAIQQGQIQGDAALAEARARADALKEIGQSQVAQSSIGGQLMQSPSQARLAGGSTDTWAGFRDEFDDGQDDEGSDSYSVGPTGDYGPDGIYNRDGTFKDGYNYEDAGGGGGSSSDGSSTSDLGGASGGDLFGSNDSSSAESGGSLGGVSGGGAVLGQGLDLDGIRPQSGGGGGQSSDFAPGSDMYGDQANREAAEQEQLKQRQEQFTTKLGAGGSRLTNPEKLKDFSDQDLESVSVINSGGQDFLLVPNRRLGELFGGTWGYIPL